MASNVRPYENDREAHAAAVAAIPPEPGWSILSQAQRDRLLRDALTAAGVETSAFEDRTAWGLGNWEDYLCATVARWIAAAHEAGKAAGPDGSATAWGLRYESDDGGDVVMPYTEEEVRQILREAGRTGPATRRTVVTRQVGPWTEAPETTEATEENDDAR
jgi:hypothetical protein